MATLGLGRTHHINTRKRVWLKSVLPKGSRLAFAGMATLGLVRGRGPRRSRGRDEVGTCSDEAKQK